MILETARIHMVPRYGWALRTFVVTFEIRVLHLRVLVTSSVWNVSIDVMAGLVIFVPSGLRSLHILHSTGNIVEKNI